MTSVGPSRRLSITACQLPQAVILFGPAKAQSCLQPENLSEFAVMQCINLQAVSRAAAAATSDPAQYSEYLAALGSSGLYLEVEEPPAADFPHLTQKLPEQTVFPLQITCCIVYCLQPVTPSQALKTVCLHLATTCICVCALFALYATSSYTYNIAAWNKDTLLNHISR